MRILYCLPSLLLLVSLAVAQRKESAISLRPMLVRIVTEEANGNGFVVGKTGDSIYIVTARHVTETVKDKNHIPLDFGGNEKDIIGGQVVYTGEGDDDVALLAAYQPAFNFTPLSIEERPDFNADLFYIETFGAKDTLPLDFNASFKCANDEKYRYQVYLRGLSGGHSGGPVFNAATNCIIGVVLEGGYPAILMQIERIRMLIQDKFNSHWQLKQY
ncbi:S1 family peptidase [Chitinophaga arvensicola]|uniref:Trypsin-like peptidase domain-containing protein n=1 Tax=Chitinophaga arvensicola TaxID=29529 RepID=A0A1I0S6E8_9BACT|nr:serine protease [Chitinophaga arvensicola]SEW51051.1 Trypsin-like peptidase domain-containing protein [Chitinophaga arvensicola]